MKAKLWYFLIMVFFIKSQLAAQEPFAKWTATELILNNGIVERKINLPTPTSPFGTTSYKPIVGEFKYFNKKNPEFQFDINNKTYSGASDWRLVGIQKIKDSKAGVARLLRFKVPTKRWK